VVRVADDGTVTVTYYDFRNITPDPSLLTDAWALHCHLASVDCSDPANWTDEVGGLLHVERCPGRCRQAVTRRASMSAH
jgi:hypothetical protein